MKARKFAVFAAILSLALFLAILAPGARAGSLSTDVIGLFPSSVGEFAYADLRQARQFSWFPQLEEQMLPARFKQFEKFLAAAGMDPNTQVEEFAWGLVPTSMGQGASSGVPTAEQILGVALGQFQTGAAQAYFKKQKTPNFASHGYTLYSFGEGSGAEDFFLLLLDSNTAAFGQRATLEKLLDVRVGLQPNLIHNDAMYALINKANGRGIVWAILNPGYTRLALQQLVPETAQFPEAATLLSKIKSLLIRIQSSNGIEADFDATCSTPDDATQMFSLLSAGFMLLKMQAANQNNPGLAQLIDGAKINPSGNQLSISIGLTNDQVVALIQSRTLALKM
ncbi:MAG TPA: hypothetical protein VGZ48_11840 [Candidatus Acidoferrales bacterium]|jgi:hypothetical protein|nr:hypothetical protein [Candidatus Acidoferrales bacterium]